MVIKKQKLMSNILAKSKRMSTEYCATVVRIGEVKPIKDAKVLGTVIVEGREIVVRKDVVKQGDIMIYVQNECQIDSDFLRSNNEFEDIAMNSNADEVNNAICQMKHDGASEEDIQNYVRAHKGYFDKKCRVRMKKLRGVMSMGYLIRIDQMTTYKKECAGINWESLIGEDFDTVSGALFVKAYVPEVKDISNKGIKKNNKLKKFSRMIPGQFSFHYDTQQLQRNMNCIGPDTSVTISVKLHGTSGIIGNIKVKKPRWSGLYSRLFNRLPSFLQKTDETYDIVCSSRSVIINDDINPGRGIGWDNGLVQKNVGIWAEYLGKYIPQGWTLYGEIVGYYEGTTQAIQTIGKRPCDYGSPVKSNQFMIYRIAQKIDGENGTQDLNVKDVHDWTCWLKQQLEVDGHKEIADRLRPIDILFHGPMKDLYPDINPENHWNEEVLERLKTESRFGMEKDEPLSKNKMPREGIVLRIDDDPIAEAFKLKCIRFLNKEADDVDQGRVDAEIAERY